jgi:hypothetical protein
LLTYRRQRVSVQTTPCATISYALTQVSAAGQVIILDSGNYAPFTVTLGVTVRAIPGVSAWVTAPSGGTAVTINVPSGTVTLVHLHIYGFGQTGATGVQVSNAGKVQIYNGSISSFSGTGIVFAPAANNSNGTPVQFLLSGTDVGFNNSGDVLIMPTGATQVVATIKNVYVHNSSSYGIKFDTESTTQSVSGDISHSNIAYHSGSAINAHSLVTGGASVNVLVNHSVIHYDNRPTGAAVYADGSAAKIVLNFSEIAHTTTAWGTANGGTTFSYGNNAVDFNTNASSPTSLLTLQ